MHIHQGWFTALYTQHLLDSQSFELEICILQALNMPLKCYSNIFFPREAIPSQYKLVHLSFGCSTRSLALICHAISTSTSTSYSQQSISDYYWETLSGTAMKMMKMGDVKA